MSKLAIIGAGAMQGLDVLMSKSRVEPAMVLHFDARASEDNLAWPEYAECKVKGKRRRWRGNDGAFGKCKVKSLIK